MDRAGGAGCARRTPFIETAVKRLVDGGHTSASTEAFRLTQRNGEYYDCGGQTRTRRLPHGLEHA